LVNDEQAFEQIFTGYYDSLYAYACSILKDNDLAEEAVQSVFCKIWERRAQLRVQTSLRAYLYGSVYHECVNWIRQERHRKIHRRHVLHSNGQGGGDHAAGRMDHAAGKTQLSQLEQRLQQALDELPDQCRAIFQLSRFGELKYREIAEQLGLSVKTVEAQVSKALKLLREKLADFL
jgi:RNA polymerase sigma-70 factor, ECF subfamily